MYKKITLGIYWPPIGEKAAHSAYEMYSWYKYLYIVSLVFSRLGFWSVYLFLIAPFPDRCLLVPMYKKITETMLYKATSQVLVVPDSQDAYKT